MKIFLIWIVIALFVLLTDIGNQVTTSLIERSANDLKENCPKVGDNNFLGALFYTTDVNTGKSLWRLKSGLRSEPILLDKSVQVFNSFVNLTHDELAVATDPDNGSKYTFILDGTGSSLYSIQWQPTWTDFYGLTNDGRLIIGHRSEVLPDNGITLFNLNGVTANYLDLPSALNPFGENSAYWDSAKFHVSPTGRQVVYDASFSTAEGPFHQRGLVLIDLNTNAEVWRTTENGNDFSGGFVGSWSIPVWSPDGSQFIYTHNDVDNDMEVALVDEYGNEKIITNLNQGVYYKRLNDGEIVFDHGTLYIPSDYHWSPNGNQIAFWNQDLTPKLQTEETYSPTYPSPDYPSQLEILDLEKGMMRSLCVTRRLVQTLFWSPDGSSLAFNDENGIGIIDLVHNVRSEIPVQGASPLLVGWLKSP